MTSPISCQGQLVRAAVQWYQCPVHYPWEPGPHTQRPPWELFNGCTVLENQTRQRWSDHRRILLSKRDRTLARVRTSGIYWRTMRHRRNGASFRDLSNIQIQSTKSVQIQSTKGVQIQSTKGVQLPSLYKYNLPRTSVQVYSAKLFSNTIPSLCKRCLVAESPYSQKNEYYQMMKSVKWFEQSRNIWIRQPTFCDDICLKLMYLSKKYNNWLTKVNTTVSLIASKSIENPKDDCILQWLWYSIQM